MRFAHGIRIAGDEEKMEFGAAEYDWYTGCSSVAPGSIQGSEFCEHVAFELRATRGGPQRYREDTSDLGGSHSPSRRQGRRRGR